MQLVRWPSWAAPGADTASIVTVNHNTCSAFPLLAGGYVIHRGRGTLAEVTCRDDRSNRYYEWASGHHDAHFDEVPGAEGRYRALVCAFQASVPKLSRSELIDACRRQPEAG